MNSERWESLCVHRMSLSFRRHLRLSTKKRVNVYLFMCFKKRTFEKTICQILKYSTQFNLIVITEWQNNYLYISKIFRIHYFSKIWFERATLFFKNQHICIAIEIDDRSSSKNENFVWIHHTSIISMTVPSIFIERTNWLLSENAICMFCSPIMS
jgi:hypothetical protein